MKNQKNQKFIERLYSKFCLQSLSINLKHLKKSAMSLSRLLKMKNNDLCFFKCVFNFYFQLGQCSISLLVRSMIHHFDISKI